MNEELKSLSDIELVKQALAENLQALGVIYDRYSSFVLHRCYVVIQNKEAAEDLMQDTFWLVINKMHLFNPRLKNADFKAWLGTIAFRTAINYRRRENNLGRIMRNIAGSENNEESNPHSHAQKKELKKNVLKALYELPELIKLLMIERYLHGTSRSDLARAFQLTIGQVDHYLNRGRRLLRNKLEGLI